MRALVLMGLGCAWAALAVPPTGALPGSSPAARPEPRAAATSRPRPDPGALRDAQQAAAQGREVSSSAAYAHFLNARLAVGAGDDRAALDQLRLALASDPANPYLLTSLAEALARMDEHAEARRILERLLAASPGDARAHLLLGRVLHESGHRRAAHHLSRARALVPDDPEPYLALIQLHLDRDDVAGAEKIADALAKAVPGETTAQRRLGLVLAKRGDPKRAERLLRRVLAHDPSDAEAWLQVASLAEADGRLEASEEALERALAHIDDPAEVLFSRGRLALRRGAQKAAHAHFTRLFDGGASSELRIRVALLWLGEGQSTRAIATLRPDDAVLREARLSFFAGLLHVRLREFAEAERAFAEAQEDPRLAQEAARERAAALSRVGSHEEALRLLTASVAARPEDPDERVALSQALERAGRAREAEQVLRAEVLRDGTVAVALAGHLQRTERGAEAIAVLEAALTCEPESVRVRQALAHAYARSGRAEEGLRLVRQGAPAWPDHAPTLNFVGYLMAESGLRLDEAERLVRRALELRPKTGAYLDSLGLVLLRQGRVEAALRALREAAGLEPFEPVILDHLGEALRRSGRQAEARRHWQRALELGLGPDVDVPPGFSESVRGKLEALSEPRRSR